MDFPKNKIRLIFGNETFEAQVVKTIFDKAKGLSGKKQLGKNEGMFFVFQFEWLYPFTMRGTLIPLDIIWLSKSLKVVHIAKDNQPCKALICPAIWPKARAKYVLEVIGGTADRLGLKIGDEIRAA